MARTEGQKLKAYYLLKILQAKTDSEHYITTNEIISELESYGIKAERKSIYSDIDALINDNILIEKVSGKGYRLVTRDFDIVEMKLLVDAIQSSKFITETKTRQLIKKLQGLVSEYEANQLKGEIYISGRVKAVNEEVFRDVDIIHSAISNNHRIRFQYFNWNEKKEMVLRHDGAYYDISPWKLTWDDENYYLVAYDAKAAKVKHYRVDKMVNLSETTLLREGKERFENFDLARYAKMNFGMFGGEERDVKLEFKNEKVGIIIDRFGKDIMIAPDMKRNGYSYAWVKVAVSSQFICWVFSLGEDVWIEGPDEVRGMAAGEVARLAKLYNV